jgi:hypothetical protein
MVAAMNIDRMNKKNAVQVVVRIYFGIATCKRATRDGDPHDTNATTRAAEATKRIAPPANPLLAIIFLLAFQRICDSSSSTSFRRQTDTECRCGRARNAVRSGEWLAWERQSPRRHLLANSDTKKIFSFIITDTWTSLSHEKDSLC